MENAVGRFVFCMMIQKSPGMRGEMTFGLSQTEGIVWSQTFSVVDVCVRIETFKKFPRSIIQKVR
jgi:hypothetical protein